METGKGPDGSWNVPDSESVPTGRTGSRTLWSKGSGGTSVATVWTRTSGSVGKVSGPMGLDSRRESRARVGLLEPPIHWSTTQDSLTPVLLPRPSPGNLLVRTGGRGVRWTGATGRDGRYGWLGAGVVGVPENRGLGVGASGTRGKTLRIEKRRV